MNTPRLCNRLWQLRGFVCFSFFAKTNEQLLTSLRVIFVLFCFVQLSTYEITQQPPAPGCTRSSADSSTGTDLGEVGAESVPVGSIEGSLKNPSSACS